MKKLVGVFATIALLGSGAALATDDKNKPQQDPAAAQGGSGQAGSGSLSQDPGLQEPATQDPAMGGSGSVSDPAMGGSGTTGSQGATMGSQSATGKEVTGKVVKSDRKTVWIDMQGAVVPLKVDKSTRFTDQNIKSARDLEAGQEIRASLEVKETDNVAKSISLSGTGGAGGDVMSPDSSINEGSTGGTGGSGDVGTGLEEDKDINQGATGGSGDAMSPDSSINQGDTGGSGDTGTMSPDTGGSGGSDTH
ncbi:MAG TPA: RNA-binding protein [Myxococcus sp.]|jgi:hypothetical protein|nr:RNA-binding protein [Myxococcus sp.]